jgi:predicted O-methyltransferase YrrM
MKLEAKRFTFRWWVGLPWVAGDIYRRLTPPDPAVGTMTYWWHGALPREPVERVFGNASVESLHILNPGRRDQDTSVTLFELSCILMAMRSVDARRVLEIGTFDGNTTLNIAANLPAGGEVTTIDLPIEAPSELALALEKPRERNITDRSILGEQFRGRQCPGRIRQVLGDSAKLDFAALGKGFDLAFIDGCHAYNYVKSDTEKVLSVMRPGGVILWHDYAMMESVSRAVDEFGGRFASLCALEGTRIAVGIVKPDYEKAAPFSRRLASVSDDFALPALQDAGSGWSKTSSPEWLNGSKSLPATGERDPEFRPRSVHRSAGT